MTVSYINLMKAQQKRHDLPASGRVFSSSVELHHVHNAAKQRLWGVRGARPGANLPRTGKAPYRSAMRDAVDFDFAMELVCEDQQITEVQMMRSSYSAAIAARHMLWTVLFDGGHPVANIARIFSVDHSTVRLGIKTFRVFQKGELS